MNVNLLKKLSTTSKITDPLLVAAIDFGTTYSGYAIQFKHEYEKDPCLIRAPQPWNGGKQNLMSYKTPTSLLLDSKKNIVCFGFEAEEKYADLCMDKKNNEFYYYRQFKMRLQDSKGLKKDSTLEDETGKPMAAIKVFSSSIKCLIEHLMKMLKNEGTGVEMKDVLWVLTVPAIWDDIAKSFMKEAAFQAGIEDGYLQIALEPEAASLYCQYLPVEKFCSGSQSKFADAKEGTVYLVADLGGGTADITIHEKLSDHKIKEIYKATGGPWGGTAVDNAFWQLFISITGGRVMARFKNTMKYDHLDFMKEIECVKRTFEVGMKTKFTIKFPASLNDICREQHKESFEGLVNQSKYVKYIGFVGDKMRMDIKLVAELFDKATDKITSHIQKLLNSTPTGQRVSMILMVGGFSESPYVQAQFRKILQRDNLKILVPKDAGLSVLNGAVIFGRLPETITERVLQCTYGVEVTPKFDAAQHPVSRKIEVPGDNPKCKGVFSPFIEEGTSVKIGHTVEKMYTSILPFQDSMIVKIYTCAGNIPQFVSECRALGSLEVRIPNPSDEERYLVVFWVFGSTTLKVLAIETETDHPCSASFELLK